MEDIEALKRNISHEKSIIKEFFSLLNYLETLKNLESIGYRINQEEKKLITYTLDSLIAQLKIINNSTPEIVNQISFFKEIPSKGPEAMPPGKEKIATFSYRRESMGGGEVLVTISSAEKQKFLKELRLTESSLKMLKKKHKKFKPEEPQNKFKRPSSYARFSNRLFSNISNELISKGYFNRLNSELRKANLPFLANTYISMALLTSLFSLIFAVLLLVVLSFFNISITYPFLAAVKESVISRFLKYFWLVIFLPLLTFFALIFYPSAEKKSLSGKINQELPFLVIHMSAVAGSKVEPTNIFKIIVMGEEYPNTKKEIKKLLNQVNIYGYDLVSALRSSAGLTSSSKLAELFNGLATTITSGGNLSEFLDKRAETLIFDYKTEREKATRMAETFMDIYISVVIAAPMIMTLLLVMMSVTPALSFGLSLQATNILMILGIVLINMIFLIFLHLKQPEM